MPIYNYVSSEFLVVGIPSLDFKILSRVSVQQSSFAYFFSHYQKVFPDRLYGIIIIFTRLLGRLIS